jgi:hypothetical protein
MVGKFRQSGRARCNRIWALLDVDGREVHSKVKGDTES